ncbi:MAG: hypothetical protein WCB51_08775 [Candidatus Dormiibacterota bacterium]
MQEQPSRRTVVLWLAAVVIIFGSGSLMVTGALNRHGAPQATSTSPSRPFPQSTPNVADCGSEIQLVGVFNDCVSIDRTAVDDCTVTPHTLYAVFKLDGTTHNWYLSLSIPRTYAEPGDYYLANGGAEVDVSYDATGADWTAVSGVLTTTTPDSRSGIVNAILQAVIDNTPVPGPTLSVTGPWRC